MFSRLSENCTKEFYTSDLDCTIEIITIVININNNNNINNISFSLVTDFFSPVLLVKQRQSPPLRLQVSHGSTFLIMCAVPSSIVFLTNLLNVFLLWLPKFFFKTFVTIPAASVVTGYCHNFLFHFRCKSLTFFLFCVRLRHIPVRCYLHILHYTCFGF